MANDRALERHLNPETLIDVFERANPEIWLHIQGDADKIRQAREIEQRMSYIRLRMETHMYKQHQTWVGKEAVKVFEERGHLDFEHPAPNWVRDQPVHVSYLEEARRRVELRNQSRLARISRAGRAMQMRLATGEERLRSLGAKKALDQTKETARFPNLESEVHAIIGRTQTVRKQASRQFNVNRHQWITQAREKGADNPEMDVFHRHRQRMNRINTAQHHLVRQAFKQRGQELPEQKQQILTRTFNQAMG